MSPTEDQWRLPSRRLDGRVRERARCRSLTDLISGRRRAIPGCAAPCPRFASGEDFSP